MKTLRLVPAVQGVCGLVLGSIAALSGGGTTAAVEALGRTVVIAGAIVIAGWLISSAITESNRRE